MKKSLFILAAALTLAACKEKGTEPQPAPLYKVTLHTDTGVSVTNGTNGETARTVGVAAGTAVTFEASVEENYNFGGWSITPQIEGVELNDETLTFDMPESNITITAKATVEPKYTVAVATSPADIVQIVQTPAGAQFAGIEITLTAPEFSTDEEWEFEKWTISSNLTLTGGTIVNDRIIRFNMPEENTGTATAVYKDISDFVRITMSGGKTVTWSKYNLSDYQTFAENAGDYGCLFQWGYDNALPYGSEMPDGWHTDTYTGDTFNPCPEGWRLPTDGELLDLIGSTEAGVVGVADGAYTTTSFSPETGFSVVPKVGDTSKTLTLPNAGILHIDGTGYYRDTDGYYWSSVGEEGGVHAYSMFFTPGYQTGILQTLAQSSKRSGYSARCVK